jgi:hypothetical protein
MLLAGTPPPYRRLTGRQAGAAGKVAHGQGEAEESFAGRARKGAGEPPLQLVDECQFRV